MRARYRALRLKAVRQRDSFRYAVTLLVVLVAVGAGSAGSRAGMAAAVDAAPSPATDRPVRDGAAREPRRPAVEGSGRWERSSPAKERIDPQRLAAAVRHVRRLYPPLETLLIVRHGKIVFERYYAGDPVVHTAQSVTKSVTSLLIGIALSSSGGR